ncbi:MAG: potassium-transporting ATPase subunit KdpC [Xanthomonadales bacterium]|nr:Potassium-transporting ATPase KdpC subunit [Xanthomonadales bacterium]MCC6594815.1 potassium-transporting ATPase subunit KdpC [Xanthomonadales bacterium]MCE7929989.1 potassium-transporting ATPase subunit KdpC [Xanthomonadales bacterium PRO6]
MNTHAVLDTRGGGLRAALVFGALSIALAGLAYPVGATLLGGWLFPQQARGSLIEREGRVLGSALLAQPFADARYFVPRPSAAGYNPTTAAGSNLAVSNPALHERMRVDSAAAAAREGVPATRLPADLVSASGSGLDPHITPAAARLQAPRVARARGWTEDQVLALVQAHTEPPMLGFYGGARVNVLRLNLALDAR